MTLVLNTTLLSNFALVQRPDLLTVANSEELVTAAEVMEGIRHP